MTYSVTKHENEYVEADLVTCVNRLLSLLDTREESDTGNVFSPTYISSCRTLHVMELGDIINRMKEIVKCSH